MKTLKFSCFVVLLTCCVLFFPPTNALLADTVTLTWDPPTTNADGTALTDLAGYKVYYGNASRSYSSVNPVIDNVTTYTSPDLAPGTYFFAVTALDAAGNESAYSNEVSKTIAAPLPVLYTLSVTRTGTGTGTVTATGISCGTDCSETVNQGTVRTLTASPASGSLFGGWGSPCSGIGQCVVTINTNVSVSALFTAQLTTTTSAATMPNIEASPGSHNFGSISVGRSAYKQFLIRNSGNANLTITKVEIAGTHAGMFSAGLRATKTISPGRDYFIRSRFSPASKGLKDAVLRIYSNDPDRAISEVPLSGTGI